jgi:CxxC motif-containing protein (DUF1111 family)
MLKSSVLFTSAALFASNVMHAQAQVAVEAAPPEVEIAARDAPRGFDNKTNNFSSQADFDEARKAFEEVETICPEDKSQSSHPSRLRPGSRIMCPPDRMLEGGGLGPVYNATSCVSCHQNPVTGSSSQISEIRAGHRVLAPEFSIPPKFNFVEPRSGSLIHQRAIRSEIQERAEPADEVRTLRMSNSTLGSGFVEVLQDQQLLDNCKSQPPEMQGTPIAVLVAVAPISSLAPGGPTFQMVLRVGRFGWKTQEASLLNFSANAYLNEMGITSPLQPIENSSNGGDVSAFDPVEDPEDEAEPGHPFGKDVELFTTFMRSTRVPPRTFQSSLPSYRADVRGGERLFNQRVGPSALKCAMCHTPQFTTERAGVLIKASLAPPGVDRATDLPDGKIPQALGNKIIRPYSDFLLHDVGTGDGIVQTQHAQLPPPGGQMLLDTFSAQLEEQRKVTIEKEAVPAGCQLELPRVVSRPQLDAADVEQGLAVAGRELDQKTANMIRTAPLWGLAVRPQLLHDGSALTIENAIRRHSGQALESRRAFETLSPAQRRQLIIFLETL